MQFHQQYCVFRKYIGQIVFLRVWYATRKAPGHKEMLYIVSPYIHMTRDKGGDILIIISIKHHFHIT